MPDTARPQPSIWRTPMRDLVRFRVTGRLDWPARLAASGLPVPVRQLIDRVVRRTRLWGLEKAPVADELIAHFADGLDAGASPDALVADFGDPKTAAKLIRRAKRRGRPLLWHVWKWGVRVFLVLLGVYVVQLVPFLLRHPVVSVDYLARLNAPLANVPEGQRAWPLYRQAIAGMHLTDKTAPPFQEIDPDNRSLELLDLTPADAAWPQLTAWLSAHTGDIAPVRQGAAKPMLGFVLGPGGSAYDPELGWNFNKHEGGPLIEHSLISVLVPDLQQLRELARVLAADARYAAAQNRGGTVTADLEAVIGMGGQRNAPFLINQLVSLSSYRLGLDATERVLAESPSVLNDRELVELAHRIAAVGGDTPGSLIDVNGERLFFDDVLQRLYSDDGHGDGIMTAEGARGLESLMSPNPEQRANAITIGVNAAIFGIGPLVGTRRQVRTEYDRLMDLQAARYARPLYDKPAGEDPGAAYRQRMDEIRNSPLLTTRYLLIAILMPSLDLTAESAERVIGRRDGIGVGLALELYHRRHGQYPTTLDALVPELLPRVPADRINGQAVKYRVIDGQPVVYSVGADGDDDGGRAPAWPGRAASWPDGSDPRTKPDGDWVLFDARPRPAPATRPAD